MLHQAHFDLKGGNRTFAAECAKVGSADKTDLDRNKHDGRSRPKPAVHSLDQMILRRADSGRSFQVQQRHGSEGRLSGRFQTLRRGVAKVGT
jgi:hypothetical protein